MTTLPCNPWRHWGSCVSTPLNLKAKTYFPWLIHNVSCISYIRYLPIIPVSWTEVYDFQSQRDILSRWCVKLPWWGSTFWCEYIMKIYANICKKNVLINVGEYLFHILDRGGWWHALWWIGGGPHVLLPHHFHLMLSSTTKMLTIINIPTWDLFCLKVSVK